MESAVYIRPLTPELEKRIVRNPLLNIDTFVIPSPYVRESNIALDYKHSYVWEEEGEVLGSMFVYSNVLGTSYLVYRLVTSPFVRGRGIGTGLVDHLSRTVNPDATIYLYLWEKQRDTVEFFVKKGFQLGESIVYRNLVYHQLSGSASGIIPEMDRHLSETRTSEEIGRTRHDARKTTRLLAHMVEMLSSENCDRIIEDINRETTSLVNTLNGFRDTVSRVHEINISQLILERIIPYVDASSVHCELCIRFQQTNVVALGHYNSYSRAFINIVANALDAISISNHDHGIMEIEVGEKNGEPYIQFRDNGIGLTKEQLELDQNGIPAFVGHSTKTRDRGEGLGTVQVYKTFGPENIEVHGEPGIGSSWLIRLRKPTHQSDLWFTRLDRRYNEITALLETRKPDRETRREEVIAYVWQTRKVEIFLFDVILHFSTYQNIRSVFRTVFSFIIHGLDLDELRTYVAGLRADRPQFNEWLLKMAQVVRQYWDAIDSVLQFHDVRGAMFRSYGQGLENIIIFTLNPESGSFFATDRKLAEHLDFAPFLGGDRERLLRGEFVGDVNDHEKPIYLGVWTIASQEELLQKLRLIRSGVKALLEMGIHHEKKLAFYKTTYPQYSVDIDSDRTVRFGDFANLSDEELFRFTRESEDELKGMLVYRD